MTQLIETFNRQESIERKISIQSKAVKLLYKYRRILLSWATGCGKTLGALKMIKLYHYNIPNIKGYIICKEHSHISNWEDDINTHGMQFINNISTKFLYASVHKYSEYGIVDFMILDECHAITPKKLEHLKKMIGPKTVVIMLSATVSYDKSILLRQLTGSYHDYHISITKAIEEGILPTPKVFIHYYELEEYDWNLYTEMSKEIDEMGELYEKEGAQWQKNKWVNLGSKRKRLLGDIKTNLASILISKEFKDKRYIAFTGSKDQCWALDSVNYVHSDLSKKDVIKKKDEFNSGKIDNLTVVNMFRESMNLNNIEKGLIVQLDNGKLSFIQMLGRVFRSNFPEMHIMVLKDTQDEKYLKNVMRGFSMKYVNKVYHE